MRAATRRRPPSGLDTRPTWTLSLALIAALLLALGGLRMLLDDSGWWLSAALVCVVVLSAPALARAYTRRPAVPLVVALVALVATVTLLFAAEHAFLGIVPTADTVDHFRRLVMLGAQSISTQSVPATATNGIVFLVAVSAGLVAAALELLAFTLRRPALTGIPLFGILIVPGFIDTGLGDPLFFALTAAAWLLVLATARSAVQAAPAVRVSVVAIAAALVLPIVLPPVVPVYEPSGGVPGYSTGINPMIDLGNDLRRDEPQVAMTYVTSSDREQYFTLATLDDFTEDAWQPTRVDPRPGTSLEVIDAPVGRAADVPVAESTTEVIIGGINGRWLPMPYAPASVTGLSDDWFWEPETLSVRSADSNIRGQEYTVVATETRPTVQQLRASGGTTPEGLERFLAVPDELPESVALTAVEVTADGATNYDKAVLLQAYFRGGDFSYSEDAPVEDGYDGTSPELIARFLEARSGYCVHFSSAMAAMARTLGIPSRIGVGFTAGTSGRDGPGEPVVYTVTTDNLHAWPELYFSDVGWVRFEPTAGRGSLPRFAAGAPSSSTPANPPSAAPEPTTAPVPTAAPTGGPLENSDPGDRTGGGEPSGLPQSAILTIIIGAAVLLLALSPANSRALRSRLRLRRVAATGAAEPAWLELRDTVDDLGWRTSEARTPHEFADELMASLDGVLPGASEAIGRIRAAVEEETFARDARSSVTVTDVHTVLAALRAAASRRDRLTALLLPASELRRWRGILRGQDPSPGG